MSKIKLIVSVIGILIGIFCISITAQATTYKYDDLGRLSEVTYNSGQKIIYTYDAGGNIKTVDNLVPELKYTVSGYIAPDFEYTSTAAPILKEGFKVEIVGTSLFTTTDANGYFEIKNVPENTTGYTIKISKINYLYREIKNVVVTSNKTFGTASNPIAMWIGDIQISGVQDNAINMTDAMAVTAAYNTMVGDPKYDPNLDLNKDGAINMTDISIVKNHFNASPASYPAI